MAKDCPRHHGSNKHHCREPYDPVMRGLQENQSGDGRHKCPYCAYERGHLDARKQLAAWLKAGIDELPDQLGSSSI